MMRCRFKPSGADGAEYADSQIRELNPCEIRVIRALKEKRKKRYSFFFLSTSAVRAGR